MVEDNGRGMTGDMARGGMAREHVKEAMVGGAW